MRTIHQRPFQPGDRSQAGHWEGDLIIGREEGSAIGTLVERQTRMVRLLHLRQRDAETLHDALKARMGDLPAALLRSIGLADCSWRRARLGLGSWLRSPPKNWRPDDCSPCRSSWF